MKSYKETLQPEQLLKNPPQNNDNFFKKAAGFISSKAADLFGVKHPLIYDDRILDEDYNEVTSNNHKERGACEHNSDLALQEMPHKKQNNFSDVITTPYVRFQEDPEHNAISGQYFTKFTGASEHTPSEHM